MSRRADLLNVKVDQCMFQRKAERGLVRKPIRIVTNCKEIASELNRRCDKTHEHVSDRGILKEEPLCVEVCRAVARGFMRHLKRSRENMEVVASIQLRGISSRPGGLPEREKYHDAQEVLDVRKISGSLAFDDLTGMALNENRVVEARTKRDRVHSGKASLDEDTKEHRQREGL